MKAISAPPARRCAGSATLFGRTPEAVAELGARAASGGVVLVPGFTGLGAPYWDGEAVGLLANLRLDTDFAALARAALDAIVQTVHRCRRCDGAQRQRGDGAVRRWRAEWVAHTCSMLWERFVVVNLPRWASSLGFDV